MCEVGKHHYHPLSCECPSCSLGQDVCYLCGAAEDELPSECPGDRMTQAQLWAVVHREADYRDGRWVSLVAPPSSPRAVSGSRGQSAVAAIDVPGAERQSGQKSSSVAESKSRYRGLGRVLEWVKHRFVRRRSDH